MKYCHTNKPWLANTSDIGKMCENIRKQHQHNGRQMSFLSLGPLKTNLLRPEPASDMGIITSQLFVTQLEFMIHTILNVKEIDSYCITSLG